MSKLTDKQRAFLRLVQRSGPVGEWCKVSDVLLPHVMAGAAEIPQLVEVDVAEKRARVTPDGAVLLAWM